MELFKKFRETIFLNESSNLESQVEELKNIRKEMKKTYDIDKDIRLLEAGLQGEKNIIFELKNANIGMYVLHDVTLEFEGLIAQIDFVIITKVCVYLVECKNMIGDITVNSQGEFKREYMLNGKKIKEAIYSPLTQAQRHKDVLKKIWVSKHKSITTLVLDGLFEKTYKPLVVLANPKSLLNIKYAPREVKEHTIRVDQLISYIKKDIEKSGRELYSSKKDMLDTAQCFLEKNIGGNKNFVEKYKVLDKENDHSNDVIQDKLEDALKQYRKSKSLKMNVPAYYVFTNAELENIVKLAPKTLDDLKNANILSPIKLKCHGEEIINIVKMHIVKV